ncbi:MAG: abortive infection family protein [Oscillospiraceae bacterium]|nr:abortive infection family protein [Oscillospiraceae bacterium]
MLFSNRYSELIKNDENFLGMISENSKKRIIKVMEEFDQPNIVATYRYDNFTITTTAINLACLELNQQFENNIIEPDAYENYFIPEDIDSLNLFNLIEIHCSQLSFSEKIEFQKELNNVFNGEKMPWLMCDGELIKLDGSLFEANLKAKLLNKFGELKAKETIFQSAFEEFKSACESYEKDDFKNAILNAELSYESVLKIATNKNQGTAKILTESFANSIKMIGEMKPQGFNNGVLSALPYIRNNVPVAHGAGATTVEITAEIANLAINLSSALNTFVVETYIKNKREENNSQEIDYEESQFN